MGTATRTVFVDESGQPLSDRTQQVLRALTPKLRRRFPTLRDEVVVTEILEEAGRRILERERHIGPIERLHGYAWVAIRHLATSHLRLSSTRLQQQTVSGTVFNVEQIDGLPDSYFTRREALAPLALIENAEAFFAATGATIRHAGNEAYYSTSTDTIVVPSPDAFQDAEGYAATKAHELAHWTKHPSRLARDLGGKTFGDEGYAREELVAELAAAFLCAELGISAAPREDHASYLSHWLGILKADKRAIFQAAAHAQKAADYLRGLQPGTTLS